MSDAQPRRLTLVGEVLAEQPEPKTAQEQTRREAERMVLEKYTPSIAKRARAAERAEIYKAAGVATLEDISLLAQVRQEHAQVCQEHAQELQRVETQWQREERKHGRHQRWLGLSFGIPIGMVFACIAIFLMQGVIWQTATDAFREQAMTGALLSGGAEP